MIDNHPTMDRISTLARVYDAPAPRYTSYPTAVEFHGGVTGARYAEQLRRANESPDSPWSLYVHVPFCRERCRFCACSVIAAPDAERMGPPYVEALERELDLVVAQIPDRRRVVQLHLGGGTPTYLSPALLRRVIDGIRARFDVQPDAEVAIEVDPRVTSPEHVEAIAACGFGRLSVGVQDFDPGVQQSIGRVQGFAATRDVISRARDLGVCEVNVDLVYGLPMQTPETFARTLDLVVALAPDRVAMYGYAHIPAVRGNQRSIDVTTLPDAETRLALWSLGRTRLQAEGYVTLGLDHFALPGDALARAADRGELHRNFMGYTVAASSDMLGFGVTAIGEIDGTYVQNTAKLSRYHRELAAGRLATERGFESSAADSLRRRVIMDVMCGRPVDRAAIERQFSIADFNETFRDALQALEPLKGDGLLEDDGATITVTETGRAFVRNIAVCFDSYRRQGEGPGRFSRAI